MKSEAIVQVDLDALCQNAVLLKNTLGEIFCVLKSDAYGHGLVRSAAALSEQGFERYAVYSISEALAVKRACKKSEVLILGRTDVSYAHILKDCGFIQTVYTCVKWNKSSYKA